MSPAQRLFFALDLPDRHREALGRRLDTVARELPPARWVRPENLHLTLAFLGDTDSEMVPGLAAAVAPAFAAAPRFETALEGAGTFPPNRPARVAWIGLRSGAELRGLRESVASSAARALTREGIVEERRPFHPHVTVARPRKPWDRRACEAFARSFERAAESGDDFPGPPFEVAEGVLYRSDLGPGGARYSVVERFPLAPAAPAAVIRTRDRRERGE